MFTNVNWVFLDIHKVLIFSDPQSYIYFQLKFSCFHFLQFNWQFNCYQILHFNWWFNWFQCHLVKWYFNCFQPIQYLSPDTCIICYSSADRWNTITDISTAFTPHKTDAYNTYRAHTSAISGASTSTQTWIDISAAFDEFACFNYFQCLYKNWPFSCPEGLNSKLNFKSSQHYTSTDFSWFRV